MTLSFLLFLDLSTDFNLMFTNFVLFVYIEKQFVGLIQNVP